MPDFLGLAHERSAEIRDFDGDSHRSAAYGAGRHGVACGSGAGGTDAWVLWLPIGVGAGAALYFELPFVIPFWAAMAAASLSALVLVWRMATGPGWLIAGAAIVLLVAGGMALGSGRTDRLAAPRITVELGPGVIVGRVLEMENSGDGSRRITLAPQYIEDLTTDQLPARVRLSVRQRAEEGAAPLRPGQTISIFGALLPPSGPAAPGAFDFARSAFFDRLGAVGYSLSAPRLEETQPPSNMAAGLQSAIADLRLGMATRIREALPGSSGGMAAALIVGDRSGITEEDLAALRGAGLAHLLAISGLHMALAAGLLFLSIRTVLALSERLALTRPIKKWAAVIALMGAFSYLILSGGSVSTQRAFIMIAVAFLAVLTDRLVLSMRTVAVAALIILALAPESVTRVGFQMSFAAVAALIALGEWLTPRLAVRLNEDGHTWWRKGGSYFASLSITSMIAGLTIAPFAAYHFNRFTNYEVAANLVAMPVMAFWVMPWGILAVLFMPLGLDGLALAPMGWGIDIILGTGHEVSNWPGAQFMVGAVAPWVLAIIALGGAWIVIWQKRWRWAGMVPIVIGFAMFFIASGPDVLIDGEARTFAVRGPGGQLQLLYPRREQYVQDSWLRRDGDRRSRSQVAGNFPCDAIRCTAELSNGWILSYAEEPQALINDCSHADVLITPMPVRITCEHPKIIIDYYTLQREGAHALTLGASDVEVRTAEQNRRGRPWALPIRED